MELLVCGGTLGGFDVCIRLQRSRRAPAINKLHKWLKAGLETVTPVSLAAVPALMYIFTQKWIKVCFCFYYCMSCL